MKRESYYRNKHLDGNLVLKLISEGKINIKIIKPDIEYWATSIVIDRTGKLVLISFRIGHTKLRHSSANVICFWQLSLILSCPFYTQINSDTI